MLDGVRLFFGFESVWQGTAVLYDRDTRSLWMHVTGECFDGPRKGRRLRPLPTGTHTTWAAWRRDHADTDAMAPDVRFAGRYFTREEARSGVDYLSPAFARSITKRDERLPLSELLLGVRAGAARRAYPLARLAQGEGVVEETVGGVPTTVWFDASSRTAVAFDARLDGEGRSFERRDGGFFERGTSNRFDLEGRCVAGERTGQRLARVESLLAEWYGWFAHHPDTTVWPSPP